MFKTYTTSLRLISNDIALLFQNFIHWNISKTLILFSTLGLGLLLSLPFIAAIIAIGYYILSSQLGDEGIAALTVESFQFTALNYLTENWYLIIILGLLAIIVLAIFISIMSYGYFLTVRLYDSYINEDALGYKKNLYFSKAHIIKFTGILAWTSLYFVPPFLYGLLGLGVLYGVTAFGLLDSAVLFQRQIIGFIAFTILAGVIIKIIVLSVRLVFSYMMLLDEKALKQTALETVKSSLTLSKWKVLRIICLIIPYGIMVGFGIILLSYTEQTRDIYSLENRINLAAKSDPAGFEDDHKYIQREYIALDILNEGEYNHLLTINNAYNPKTDGVERDYLRDVYPLIKMSGKMDTPGDIASVIIFTLISFLCLEGIMMMVYFSIFGILKAEAAGVRSGVVKNNVPEKPPTRPTVTKLATKEKVKTTKRTPVKKSADSKKSTAAKTTATKPATKASTKKKPAAKTKKS